MMKNLNEINKLLNNSEINYYFDVNYKIINLVNFIF